MPTASSSSHAAPRRSRVQDLCTAEALLVSVLRLWTEPLREPERSHPHWQDGLTAAGLSTDAAAAFDTMMRIVIAATTRTLDLHRPPCPTLGADESRLLDMLRLAQQGRHGDAGVLLNDWLPLAGVRMALAPLCVLAAALQRGGLRLPDPWERHRTAAMAAPMHATDRGATLLH